MEDPAWWVAGREVAGATSGLTGKPFAGRKGLKQTRCRGPPAGSQAAHPVLRPSPPYLPGLLVGLGESACWRREVRERWGGEWCVNPGAGGSQLRSSACPLPCRPALFDPAAGASVACTQSARSAASRRHSWGSVTGQRSMGAGSAGLGLRD